MRLRNLTSGMVVNVRDGHPFSIDSDWGPADGNVSERSETPDKAWKVAELKAYADEHGIDLGDATKKDDILAAIEAAGEEADDDESDDGAGNSGEDE